MTSLFIEGAKEAGSSFTFLVKVTELISDPIKLESYICWACLGKLNPLIQTISHTCGPTSASSKCLLFGFEYFKMMKAKAALG